jgi:diguanylate cyclase (GGDEF)-like protein
MDSDGGFGESQTKLVATRDLARSGEDAAPRLIPTLIFMDGIDCGASYRIEQPRMVLGRSETADLRVIDSGVSRHHAQIHVEEGRVLLEDLGSMNGTFVNGVSFVGRRVLEDGDKIGLGPTIILKLSFQDPIDERFQQRIYDQVTRDALTGAYKRECFDDRLAVVSGARRVALLMLDVDHFKRINDTHGHPVGDAVLVEIANRVRPALRKDDFFARYGGEEFAVLCAMANLQQAAVIGERVRTAIAGHPFTIDDLVMNVTVSVGISAFPTTDVRTSQQLLATADAALYCAKTRGRNQVAVYRGERVDSEAPTDPASSLYK